MRSVHVALATIAGAVVVLAIAVLVLAGAVASTVPPPSPTPVCVLYAPGLPTIVAPGVTCPPR